MRTGIAARLRSVNFADAATLVVALGTLALAAVTYQLAATGKKTLETSIRPLLVDPRPASATDRKDMIQFGPPGRRNLEAPRGQLSYETNAGGLVVSIAFENVGAGVAAIEKAETDPSVLGTVFVSRKFVPVGEIVRVNVSILVGGDHGDRFAKDTWAMEDFAITISYTDAEGGQPCRSRASFRQFATQGPFVEKIEIFQDGNSLPVATGQGSY